MKKMITLIALLCISYQNINAQLQIDDIKIDTNISGFHFTADYDGSLIYTPNGQADIGVVKNPSAFSVSIMTNSDYESAKDKIEELIEISALHDGNTQDQIVRKDTMVQGFRAYTVSLRETKKGSLYHNLIFYGFILRDEEAVLFISGDLEKGKHIEKFRKTFYALKFKY